MRSAMGIMPRRSPENFIGGDPHDVLQPLDFFVWAIVGAAGAIIVDTGFDEAMSRRRQREITKPLSDGLAALGIAPDSVARVIVSHLHYDHCGNYELFPQARYHLQDREMAYATGRCMCHQALRLPFEADDVVAMVRKVFAGRVVFHDGDDEIVPGVTVHRIGGHSMGLQSVRVKTRRGHVMLAADAAHLYAHIDQGRIFPITYNVGEVLEGYETLKKLATSRAISCPVTIRWCWNAIRRQSPASKAGSHGSTWSRPKRNNAPTGGLQRPSNLLVFGKPFGARRPASARLPRQSASSFSDSVNTRPAESVQLKPFSASKTLDVGQAAVLVPLQAHAAAARHLRHLIDREHHHLAVLADRGDQFALGRRDGAGFVGRLDVEDLLALAGIGEALVLGNDKAPALLARDDQLAAALIAEHRDHVGLLLELDEQPDRLAVAAAARQLRRLDGVAAAVGGEDQKLRRRLGKEGELETVVGLECQAREVGDLAAQRADPALFRHHDRDRLALDQGFLDGGFVVRRRLGEAGAALAERRFRTEPVAHLADLSGNGLPLRFLRAQQLFDRLLFRAQRPCLPRGFPSLRAGANCAAAC